MSGPTMFDPPPAAGSTPTPTIERPSGLHVPSRAHLGPKRMAQLQSKAWKRDPGTFAYKLTHTRTPPIASAGGQKWRADFRHTAYLAQRYRRLVATPNGREIWNLPPRYGKSLLASVFGPAWTLDLWPWKRIMVATYARELALQFGRDVRNLINEYPDLLRVSLRQDSQAAGRWNTPAGGGFLAAGFDTIATGFGADMLVIDDPFKDRGEADSEVIRKDRWETWDSTFKTRLEPGGSVLVVQTRWHEDDLTGRMLQSDKEGVGEGWTLIRLPEIAEDPQGDDAFPHPVTGEPMVDPLGRAPGEVLEPKRFGEVEVYAKHASTAAYTRASLYQQRPAAAEGGIFKRAWWNFWSVLPAFERFDYWLQSWDMSFKDVDESSYVVGQLWARIGGRFFLIDQLRFRGSFPETVKAVIGFKAKHPQTNAILIEDKANGPAVISTLKGRIPGIIDITPQGSKESRANAVAATVEAGDVWIPEPDDEHPWVSDYVEELANFPTASHDDQVDATTQALMWLNRMPSFETTGDDEYVDERLDDRR